MQRAKDHAYIPSTKISLVSNTEDIINGVGKLLIIGGDSQIGVFLKDYLGSFGYEIFNTTKRKINKANSREIFLDLSKEFHELARQNFDAAIFCAGITDISKCEEFPINSKIINVDNTIKVIESLLLQKTHVIFLSSNAVFDGTKQFCKHSDNVSPTNNYGKYKVIVEKFFEDPKYSTLRLTKVLSRESTLFTRWQKHFALGERELFVYKNHFISPVTLQQVGQAVHLILKENANGTFQLGSSYEISYYDLAIRYFASNKKALNLIVGENDPAIISNKYNSLLMHLPANFIESNNNTYRR